MWTVGGANSLFVPLLTRSDPGWYENCKLVSEEISDDRFIHNAAWLEGIKTVFEQYYCNDNIMDVNPKIKTFLNF